MRNAKLRNYLNGIELTECFKKELFRKLRHLFYYFFIFLFISQAQYPFGCLSPNKECSLDDDKPSQSVQGENDELNKIDDTYEENTKLIASSETSSLSSSLGQDDKENNTRGHISLGATGEDQIAAMSEDQIRGKDRISGVKRKLSESDISNPVCSVPFDM